MLLELLSVDEPLDALPPLDVPDELGEEVLDESVALGDEELDEPVALGEELEEPLEELCAIATLAIAKSAAAVAVPTNLIIWVFLRDKG